jgi:hypothetical protein
MVECEACHRTPFQREVTLLTSILRLHCQPPPSYREIAEPLLKTWPDAVRKLVQDVVPLETQAEVFALESSTKEWLTGYLQESYDFAEQWDSDPWTTARDKDRSMVEEILRVTGLKEMGYKVMDREEMQLQMKWKKEGDWRYLSTPEPVEAYNMPPSNISKFVVEPSNPQVPTTRKIAIEIFQVLSFKGHNTHQERNTSKYQTLKDIAKRIEVMSMVEAELEGNDKEGEGLRGIRIFSVSS